MRGAKRHSIYLLCFFSFLILVSLQETGSAKEGRLSLSGRLNPEPSCGDSALMIFLSQESTLIQQLEVPPKGTFNFEVNPGRYTLAYTNHKDCVGRESVDVKLGASSKVELKAASWKRLPAAELTANCACVQAAGCPCGVGGYGIPNYIYPSWQPWWVRYSAFYPNFFYPGPWSYFGLHRGFFPGHGNVGIAKPNLYLYGRDGTTATVELELNSKVRTTWLASAPDYDAGWIVKLKNQNVVEVDGTGYRYLYYDLRADDTPFQATKGFCAERNEAIEKMSKILSQMGFIKTEIADFEDHWRVKMPPRDVCVFPQANSEMDRIAKLKIQPMQAQVTRLLFVVAYKDGMAAGRTGKFRELPQAEWKHQDHLPSKNRRELASKDSSKLVAREWGVAFTFDPKDRK